jgi:hypothetical protein
MPSEGASTPSLTEKRGKTRTEAPASGEGRRPAATPRTLPSPRSFSTLLKNDLFAERTSDRSFLANNLRLFYACAGYVLHHALRIQVHSHTELARTEPGTVIVKLFKRALRVVPQKRRVYLHLPTSCPVKGLLHRASEILYRIKPPPRAP